MKLTVVQYLAKKLKSIGVKNVFGLPGDYNFNILDAIIEEDGIDWTNCTNELNAGYAADGYARINGYGAVVTTYGVGELSAANAIAGSYAESLPVMHIAGVPTTSFIKNKVCVHHNFSDVNYYAFENIFKNITGFTSYLTFENAKREIDKAINHMVNEKTPSYLAIPIDVCRFIIECDDEFKVEYKKTDEKKLKQAGDKVLSLIEKSKKPLIFFDHLIKRFKLQNEIKTFIDKTNMEFGTFLMAKGVLDETDNRFAGVNVGNFTEKVSEKIDESDLIITAGFLNADLNTGGFTAFNKAPYIQIQKTRTIIGNETFDDVLIQDIIPYLAKNVSKKAELKNTRALPPLAEKFGLSGQIKVDGLFSYIKNAIKENDIFVMETGLMSLSGAFLSLKKGVEYLSQTLWGSIGWATPAAFGASMADKKRNLVLFTGDGAHQLTAQELANYFEYDLKPVIFLLNNDGYTVERVLSKDPEDKFNNITKWDYFKMTEALSGGKDFYRASVSTYEELKDVILKVNELKGKKLCYVEIKTDKNDFTKLSSKLVSNMKNFSAKLN